MIELTVMGVAALVLIAVVAWHVVDTVWARRLVARRRVVVELRTEQTIAGLMWSRRGRTLVLKNAELLAANGSQPLAMDGDIIVDRDQVVWVQVAG